VQLLVAVAVAKARLGRVPADRLGMLLARLARSRPHGRLAATLGPPRQTEDPGVPFISADQGGGAAWRRSSPTLGDDLLSYEPH
jgi:hypothetical protein